jgi:hypothetical protein
VVNKSKESSPFLALLDMLVVDSAVITIDATGLQRGITWNDGFLASHIAS